MSTDIPAASSAALVLGEHSSISLADKPDWSRLAGVKRAKIEALVKAKGPGGVQFNLQDAVEYRALIELQKELGQGVTIMEFKTSASMMRTAHFKQCASPEVLAQMQAHDKVIDLSTVARRETEVDMLIKHGVLAGGPRKPEEVLGDRESELQERFEHRRAARLAEAAMAAAASAGRESVIERVIKRLKGAR